MEHTSVHIISHLSLHLSLSLYVSTFKDREAETDYFSPHCSMLCLWQSQCWPVSVKVLLSLVAVLSITLFRSTEPSPSSPDKLQLLWCCLHFTVSMKQPIFIIFGGLNLCFSFSSSHTSHTCSPSKHAHAHTHTRRHTCSTSAHTPTPTWRHTYKHLHINLLHLSSL